jgi:hypothetical protein
VRRKTGAQIVWNSKAGEGFALQRYGMEPSRALSLCSTGSLGSAVRAGESRVVPVCDVVPGKGWEGFEGHFTFKTPLLLVECQSWPGHLLSNFKHGSPFY